MAQGRGAAGRRSWTPRASTRSPYAGLDGVDELERLADELDQAAASEGWGALLEAYLTARREDVAAWARG